MVEDIRKRSGFANPDSNTADANNKLHEFAAEARMCKDEYEVREMRKAVAATKHGFDNILRKLPSSLGKPRSERMLEGAFNAIPARRAMRSATTPSSLPALTLRFCIGCVIPVPWSRRSAAH